jgi:hypothetical protein
MTNLENRFLYELKTFSGPFGETVKGLVDLPSLRDQFAMAALFGVNTKEFDPKEIASKAFAIADAMMEARK